MASQYLRPLEQVGAKRTYPAGQPQKYFLDDHGRRLIMASYDGSLGRGKEIAEKLKVPPRVLYRWASELGVSRKRDRKWTLEEIDYLEQHLPRMHPAEIARHLDRTERSVRYQAEHLGLRKTDDGYTLQDLAQGFGCTRELVHKWIKQGYLRGTKRNTGRTEGQGGDIWYFSARDVREFVKNHSGELNRKCSELPFTKKALQEGRERGERHYCSAFTLLSHAIFCCTQ